jgi:hypothetical protein
MSDYLKLNQANWDERAPLHAASKEYASVGCGHCICNAISVPTPCPWPAWARR